MTLSFWQEASRGAERSTDIAVVGGGVVGCATAYWLRRLVPQRRIAIVEAGRLASGASGRNAGFLLQGTAHGYLNDLHTYGEERTRRLWSFTNENRRMLAAELDPAVFDMKESGSMTVAGTRAEDERLRQALPRMRAHRISVVYHSPDEANRRLCAEGFQGALYVTTGATMNPAALVRYLAEASGAEVWEHHPVASMREERGEVVLETTRCRIRAERVVLALNAYLPRLCPDLGRYVRPVRAQMLATAPASTRWLRIPAYTHDGYFYIRQLPSGVLLLGGARHLHRDVEVGYEDQTTPTLQQDLEAYLARHFPEARNLPVQQRWSGTMGFSPDGLPVVGTVPGAPACVWAAGFHGHGMSYGFRFGRLLAEQVVGGRQPDDYDLFAAERFDRAGDLFALPAALQV